MKHRRETPGVSRFRGRGSRFRGRVLDGAKKLFPTFSTKNIED